MTTPEKRAELRRLADAATPGPWEAESYDTDGWRGVIWGDTGAEGAPRLGADMPLADAKFCAAARTAVPALLDEVERLEAALRIAEYDAHVIGPANADEVKAILEANAELQREVAVLRATPDGKMAALFDEQVAENNRWSRDCEALRAERDALRAWVARAREAMEDVPLMHDNRCHHPDAGGHTRICRCLGECTCWVGPLLAVLADAPKEGT